MHQETFRPSIIYLELKGVKCHRLTMTAYRRHYSPGATCFFTVNLKNRQSRLLVERADDLRDAWRQVKADWPFETLAICILPDHLHCILRLPDHDENFSVRWMRIKTLFTRKIPKSEDPAPGARSGERGIWQRRYWDHMIRDERDFETHVNDIHGNPVHHGYVADPDDWPWSSWHRYKREFGRFWNADTKGNFGE